MKRIWKDFNGPNQKKLRLTDHCLQYFELKQGDEIVFYDEDFEGIAIVEYDNEQQSWCGRFISDVTIVSKDIEEARVDGFINGKYFENRSLLN